MNKQALKTDNQKTAEKWNRSSESWYEDIDELVEEIIKKPEIAFPESVYCMLKDLYPSFEGLNICVPSSGDNTAVYAFHLLGAKVTSLDISEEQIRNAKKTADIHGWDISFICDDSTFLESVEDESFDLIYTSNGVHIWIPSLNLMYENFNRVLKPGGSYVFFETHPMSRPFDDSGEEIKIIKKYTNIEPIVENGIKYYEWCIQDFVNAMVSAEFDIKKMVEFYSSRNDFIQYDYIYDSVEERIEDKYRKYDWKENPWAALPQCFGMSVRKR